MKTRTLGKDFTVSAVGLGCMGMSHGYGQPKDVREMTELLAKAVDAGYTFFDTAEVYGTADDPHANETLLGQALKPFRNRIQIGTKFGIHFDMTSPEPNKPIVPDARPDLIRKSVEASLQRLQTDHIDIYYQHRQDPKVPVEDVAAVMADLMQEGKILHWGLSEVDADTLRRAHAVCPVTAVQNRYSMMARWYEKMFPVLEELQVGLVAFSPMANGFLTARYDANSQFDPDTDYRRNMPQFQADAMEENKALLQWIQDLAASKQATPAQLSLAWMLSKQPWIVPIPGTTNPGRLLENGGAADIELTADEVRKIDEALDKIQMSSVFGGSVVRG